MYNAYENIGIKDGIKNTISEIDQKIAENSKALFEAQIVKLRSTFSNSNNFIQRISKDVYKIKLEDSINWHQKQLKNLYFERRQLQIQLEKIQGNFLINRIKRFLFSILILCIILLTLFIFISGFMVIIYLLPLILLTFLSYHLIKKRS